MDIFTIKKVKKVLLIILIMVLSGQWRQPIQNVFAEDRRAAQDLGVVFNDKNFITDIFVKVDDKVISDHQNIDVDKPIDISIKFEIPDAMLQNDAEYDLLSGDYLIIGQVVGVPARSMENPASLKDGNREIGTYQFLIDENGQGIIKVVFNKSIEYNYSISGEINYQQSFDYLEVVGETEIAIPFYKEIKKYAVNVTPAQGEAISKSNDGIKGDDTINWKVLINTDLESIHEGATVNDPIGDHPDLELIGVVVYEVEIDRNANVVNKNKLSSETLESLVTIENETVTFNEATNKAYEIHFLTKYTESFSPKDGETVTFINKATFTNNGFENEATSTATYTYKNFLIKDKGVADANGNHIYNWTLHFNNNNRPLAANQTVNDFIVKPTTIEYVHDSFTFKDYQGNFLNYVENEDYTIEFVQVEGQPSFKITFLKEVDHYIQVNYQTKYTGKNNANEYPTILNTAESNGTTTGNEVIVSEQGLTKGIVKLDNNTKTVNWRLVVNHASYDMYNWSLTDIFTTGQQFKPESFKMTWSNGQIINPNTYNLVETENGFSVSFKSDDVISDMFTIEYQTSFDPSIDNFYHENNKYIVKNNANHYWSDAEGNIYTSFAEDSAPISQNLTSDATKGSFFNAKEGLITWSIAANYRQQKLFNAHIIDTISDDQEIVAIRLYEANISAQGVATKVNDTLKNIEIPIGKTIDISLPNDSIKTYILEIDTKPNSRQNEIVYNNKAIYRKNLVEAHVEAELKPYYSNNHLEKNATPNFHAVDWEVFVNMAQSTLLEPVIKDIPSLNQVIHENSIKVELLELRSDNQPGYVSAVEVGKDVYNYVLHMDQMTGQQTLTINFLGEITSAYRITYKTSIINNGGSTSVEVSNSVSLEGKEKEIIETITSEKTTVETIYGSATSKEARVTLKKIDSVNENVTLQGVKLELWSTVNGIADVKLREGVTDENGQVTFGALRTETDYKIFEKNARPGYTIDEQLIYGNKKENGLNARIENDDLKNNGIIISVKNDVTKVQFKKVGSNALNSGLKDAKFIVTRLNDETTEYYLGLNSNRIAQWSNNKDDALKIISEVNGSVVVEGLSQFDKGLKLIEISAPDGYIMDENKAIDFVMVENENKTVTIEEKPQDIINTQIPRINLRINKQWNDGNNADGIRPEEIKVKLFADNVEVGEATLGQHNGWKYTFTNLLEYSKTSETSYSNEKIKYTIVEATVTNVIPETIDNTKIEHTYESTSERNNNTFNITNTHDYAKTSISGLKTWPTGIEEHGNRPSSITIELLANGVKVDSQIVSSDTNWTYHFENKPLRAKGYTINYTVSEAKVLNYTPIYSNNNRDVTNTYTPEMTSLSGRKIWDDGIEADFSRPESIQIEVYGVNKEEPVRTITVDNQSRNSWNFKVDNLRKYENQQIIEYTFKEVNVDSRYTPTYNKSTQTITNSYTPEVVDVEGLKVWSDTNNQDGKRPSEITVDLLANGIKVDTKTFTLKSDGKFVFTNVRKNYNSGQPIIYTFREHAVKDYVTTYSEDTKTITNTHAIEHINIEVNKHWNDADNQDGVRPNNVTVILKADDKEIQRQLLNADNNWTHTFENLPKYLENEQGKLINYTVEEVQLTEAYSVEYKYTYDQSEAGRRHVTAVSVTNSHTPELIKVSGQKIWEDAQNQDGIRPSSITIDLLADGIKVDEEIFDMNETDTFIFANLPKYRTDKVGELIVYTFEEHAVDGYTTTYSDDTHTITNVHTPELISVSGLKVWEDTSNQDNKRPEIITIELYVGETFIKEQDFVVSVMNEQEFVFTDVQKFANGEEIVYSFKEKLVEHYSTSYSNDTKTITNTYSNEVINIDVTKKWDDHDNQDAKRYDKITINLMVDKSILETVTKDVDTNGSWTHTFENLPKYAENSVGEVIDYEIEEVIADDEYSASYQYSYDDSDAENPHINKVEVTNTHTLDTISISGLKVWDDNFNQDGKRPEMIIVELYANDDVIPAYSFEVTGDDIDLDGNWKFVLNDIEKNRDGVVIKYTVKERLVIDHEYEAVIEHSYQEAQHDEVTPLTSIIITNTYVPKVIPIAGIKTWDDGGYDIDKPLSITVYLYATINDEVHLVETMIVTPNEKNKWTYNFGYYDLYVEGQMISYHVVEEAVLGYNPTYDDQYNILNTYDEFEDVLGFKPSRPSTGIEANSMAYMSTFILSGLFIGINLYSKRKQNT